MKGLIKSELHQVKEAFDLASFCKKWWKSLVKEMKKSGISKFQTIQVLCKLIEGLHTEALLFCESLDDEVFIKECVIALLEGDSK